LCAYFSVEAGKTGTGKNGAFQPEPPGKFPVEPSFLMWQNILNFGRRAAGRADIYTTTEEIPTTTMTPFL